MSRVRFLLLGLVCSLGLWPSVVDAQETSLPAGTQTPQAADPASRKVWTNEDVPTLREDSAISTVGAPATARASSGTVHRSTPGRQDAKWYADQITKLQAQLRPINDNIAKLQAGIDGKFTGDSQTSTRPKGVSAGDWRIELAQLEKQRDEIESHISQLRDQARHQGVPPSALP